MKQQFASDNYAGICPEAWAAMEQANDGHAYPYGEDAWTGRVSEAFATLFGTDCAVFLVPNGTGANSLALAACCRPYHAVICAETAHVRTDECGAPGFYTSGTTLLTVPGMGGKLPLAAIAAHAGAAPSVHSAPPRAVSISQTTETGEVYSVGEVAAIGAAAHAHGLAVHMDGARFANACAALGVPPAEVTWRAGVDVLCFGGTKNGMAGSEAIVFFDRSLADDFAYRRKQTGQLTSKMRFIAAPWLGMLADGAWLRHAAHANAAARRLAQGATSLPGVRLAYANEANAVFLRLPDAMAAGLRGRGWRFYTVAGAARFMCAWDTELSRVDALLEDMRAVQAAAPCPAPLDA